MCMPRRGGEERRVVWIVLVNVALYATCFQFQRPIEPFLLQKLGGRDEEYGRLQSFFSLFQMVGSPVVGATLDRLGARAMFVVVFLSSACSYGILSMATSMAWLYASKVPSVLQAGFLVAQALVAGAARTEEQRAAALGRLTTAYTVGRFVGPALGGELGASGDYYLGARLAVAGSLLSACLALALPPPPPAAPSKAARHDLLAIATRRAIWPLLLVKVATGVSNSALDAALPLVLRDAGFTERHLGYAMACASLLVAFVAAFLVGPATAVVGGSRLLAALALGAKVALVAGLTLALALAGPAALAAAAALHDVSAHLLATSLTAATTGAVTPDEQGTLLGLEHALFAVARIFGPTLGTKLLATANFSLLALAAAALDFAVLLFALRFVLRPTRPGLDAAPAPEGAAARKKDEDKKAN